MSNVIEQRVLSLMALVSLTGCAEPDRATMPSAPDFELYEPTHRLDPKSVNAHVYGSFAIPFTSGGVITSGPANFPGHPPAGEGTCENGRWINSRGKPTAGTLDHPHPHCVMPTTALEVVLEPISACFSDFGPCLVVAPSKALFLGATATQKLAIVENLSPTPVVSGSGIVVAYAVDAATLGTTNNRVGILSFDLAQYSTKGEALFDPDCSVDGTSFPCLERVIVANYKPLPPEEGGVGEFTAGVPGFLWWSKASMPYNY